MGESEREVPVLPRALPSAGAISPRCVAAPVPRIATGVTLDRVVFPGEMVVRSSVTFCCVFGKGMNEAERVCAGRGGGCVAVTVAVVVVDALVVARVEAVPPVTVEGERKSGPIAGEFGEEGDSGDPSASAVGLKESGESPDSLPPSSDIAGDAEEWAHCGGLGSSTNEGNDAGDDAVDGAAEVGVSDSEEVGEYVVPGERMRGERRVPGAVRGVGTVVGVVVGGVRGVHVEVVPMGVPMGFLGGVDLLRGLLEEERGGGGGGGGRFETPSRPVGTLALSGTAGESWEEVCEGRNKESILAVADFAF